MNTANQPHKQSSNWLKVGTCGLASLLIIAACLALSIIFDWFQSLLAIGLFNVATVIICSFSVIVNLLTILCSYELASKISAGVPQDYDDKSPIRGLVAGEFLILGLYFVFIRESTNHIPNTTHQDLMVSHFVMMYGTFIRGMGLVILDKLNDQYNRSYFGHVHHINYPSNLNVHP